MSHFTATFFQNKTLRCLLRQRRSAQFLARLAMSIQNLDSIATDHRANKAPKNKSSLFA